MGFLDSDPADPQPRPWSSKWLPRGMQDWGPPGPRIPYVPCHEGASLLCTSPDVYIASGRDVNKWLDAHSGGMLLDVGNVTDLEVSSNYGFYVPGHRKVLKVYWPDMGVVDHQLGLWLRIAEELKRDGGLICCMGGHGRSGSAAAIMLTLLGKCEGKEATAYIRKHHCKEAVETQRQLQYLDELLGHQTERELKTPFFMKGGALQGTTHPTSSKQDTPLTEREEWYREFDYPWGI